MKYNKGLIQPKLQNLIIFTNNPDSIKVREERRIVALECNRELWGHENFKRIYGWFNKGGNEIVANYLMNYDLNEFDETKLPTSVSAASVYEENMSSIEMAILDIIEDRKAMPLEYLPELINSESGNTIPKSHLNIKKIGRYIRELGFEVTDRKSRLEWHKDGKRNRKTIAWDPKQITLAEAKELVKDEWYGDPINEF